MLFMCHMPLPRSRGRAVVCENKAGLSYLHVGVGGPWTFSRLAGQAPSVGCLIQLILIFLLLKLLYFNDEVCNQWRIEGGVVLRTRLEVQISPREKFSNGRMQRPLSRFSLISEAQNSQAGRYPQIPMGTFIHNLGPVAQHIFKLKLFCALNRFS